MATGPGTGTPTGPPTGPPIGPRTDPATEAAHRYYSGFLRPRWGHQTGLFQFRQPAFYLFFALLLLSGLAHLGIQSSFREISASGFALSWLLMLVYALPLFLLIYFLDLYEREPMTLVLGALLWGGLVATVLAGIANEGWGIVLTQVFGPDFAAKWSAALTAPFTEEILKALGVVLIYLIARDEMDDMMDGFVYGAMVGLGFAVVEDVFYFITVFGGSISGVLTGFFLRVVASGLYSHAVYTGLVGMGIAYFTSRRGEATFGRRLGVAAGLLAVAVFAHFLWNSPLLNFFPEYPWTGGEWLLIPIATSVKGLPFLVFLIVMIRLAHRRERRWLDAALTTEVGGPGLTAEELATLRSPRQRRRARKETARLAGPGAAATLKRLQRAQIDLAMVRSRVHRDDDPDLIRQRELCSSLRGQLTAQAAASPPLSS